MPKPCLSGRRKHAKPNLLTSVQLLACSPVSRSVPRMTVGGRAGGRGCSLAARPPILRIRPQQPLVNLRAAQVLRGPSGIQCP